MQKILTIGHLAFFQCLYGIATGGCGPHRIRLTLISVFPVPNQILFGFREFGHTSGSFRFVIVSDHSRCRAKARIPSARFCSRLS